MARIKIEDLQDSREFTEKEMQRIYGGPNRRDHDHIGTFLLDTDFGLITNDLLSTDDGIIK